ncbi:uroporphyrinogen-III synthase [Arthrobacter sp. PAMC25284]|uniref:Uroporphyrinogen-III synthase n=1 Tax=Arthrobacter oryzae TaxID=409290 RepID=A0A3N0BZY0_9MICC|nr:uroporphyrinogen-III synthase [Arthrobacter sp. PAMC25284]RNL55479.1 uroporphyrinogen-III synthase [Arthrobacter oryzae]
MPEGDTAARADQPLEGFRIGVTSDRRSQDLIEALERRGAEVLHAPALKIAPVQEDLRLIEDTRAIIDARPDLCIATTAYGMRRWCEAADTFGIGEQLLETLGACRMFVRGPKARGAVRAAGLADVGISSDETTATLVDMLLAEGVRGKTVAVQLHGYTDVRQLERLRMSGATVLTVTPYRWVKPDGEDRLPRLIEAVCSGNLDVLTFTSAPAVDALWSTAHEMGMYRQLVECLKTTVTTAVVGPVTAQPLLDVGLHPLIPERYRMGALIRLVCEHLALNHVRRLDTVHGSLELRGRSLRIDGEVVELAPAPLLLLRALLGAGGAVLSRESLADLLELRGSVHALDMTVSRLRSALPDGRLIETVVKRGYRIRT